MPLFVLGFGYQLQPEESLYDCLLKMSAFIFICTRQWAFCFTTFEFYLSQSYLMVFQNLLDCLLSLVYFSQLHHYTFQYTFSHHFYYKVNSFFSPLSVDKLEIMKYIISQTELLVTQQTQTKSSIDTNQQIVCNCNKQNKHKIITKISTATSDQ